jgi:DNA replication and repair protein RecF
LKQGWPLVSLLKRFSVNPKPKNVFYKNPYFLLSCDGQCHYIAGIINMTNLQQISLFQFKNYVTRNFVFTQRIVGICGNNGVGKTNLLDAIHYLCFTKSYFSKSDAASTYEGAQGFRIAGSFNPPPSTKKITEPVEIICVLRETGKKEFSIQGDAYEKFAHHIGKFPCVFIAPDDVQLITGASEDRRKFLDTLLSQLDGRYLQSLIDYNKTLQQRNGYLKSLPDRKLVDNQLLDVYDQQLIIRGNYVFEQRNIFLKRLLPLIKTFCAKIAGIDEDINITYSSALLQQSFTALLQQSREKDLFLQRTTQGIHRDDIEITLREQAFKLMASQGQRKSLLFAMKLAEFELLKEAKGFPPILLLDDVFEKLDESRMHNLLQWVCVQNQGPVFITDTHKNRLQNALDILGQPFQIIELN